MGSEADFSALPAEAVLQRLDTSMNGLSHEQVRRRHVQYGFNAPASEKEPPAIFQLLAKFKNPLVLVLLLVATVSFLTGQYISAILVFGMALFSVLLSFIQEYKANQEAKKLTEMVSTTATVLRSGKLQEVNMRLLVPGDIVYLSAGDLIPADVRIVNEKDLFINQAALTGESFPVEKTATPVPFKDNTITGMTNIAFLGSNVVSGTALGVVIKTGSATQFGELAVHVSHQHGDTNFDVGINNFVFLMIRFMLILVSAIFVINVVLKGNMLEALLFSLAVAVGLTPEMLPMIITVNLSNGALAMSKKKVIVKKLSAIQNFGAMDILCTDKTGTLTLGEVILERHFDLNGKESEDVLKYAYINSYFQTGLKNLLDKAILKHEKHTFHSYRKIDEIPFDFNRKIMSVVVEGEGKHMFISKGAPEEIVRRCTRYEIDGKVYDIHEKISEQLLSFSEKYEKDGFRVLALAYKDSRVRKAPYSKKDESDLILKGFMIFLDPPKPTAKHVIEALKNLGIQLKVLTGDNELVTKKICGEVGLDVSGGVVTGEMLDKMSDEELGPVAEKTAVFARLTPLQKERVILALKKKGRTVGYLGDGINDAPALKSADVGITVNNAVDIAKETADIILLKKSLYVLTEGVIEGRKTYANILKYIKMGSSSNFGNMFSLTGASIFLPFLPMRPIQILLNNFLYDMSQLAIPTDHVDQEYLVKPAPWNIEYIKKVMVFFGPISSVFDFVTFGVLLYFEAAQPLFNTVWFLESLFTQTLVIHIIRTSKIPFIESRPSKYLVLTSIIILLAGLFIVFSPLAIPFGFVQPPPIYLALIACIVVLYLVSVQLLKHWFIKKYGYE
ncbi:Copper-exporting P-type ATPase B [Candidatus Burarchaeum australiense]|nr:Copper-exporting P-type ATPase B [Candidatus Burarchaeum australiense]